jgi:hypothetical protein
VYPVCRRSAAGPALISSLKRFLPGWGLSYLEGWLAGCTVMAISRRCRRETSATHDDAPITVALLRVEDR